MTRSIVRLASRIAFFVLPTVMAGACIHDGFPLGPTGTVDVRVDVSGSLFSTDVLDATGKPAGPRQTPFETAVELFLQEGDEPAYGGYVSVRVEPSQALVLRSAKGEADGPSCQIVDEAFRCMASSEGLARFIAASQSDWSGEAKIIVTWANLQRETTIDVAPAGLPADATNFTLVGFDSTERVNATFVPLECTLGPVPDDLGSKWRTGAIRFREVFLRATAPTTAPSVLENAPITVESLSSEAELSLTQNCEERKTRLRLTLGKTGESDRFFVCFSDLGGDTEIAVTSGALAVVPNPTLEVEAEPRLLRVATLAQDVDVSDGNTALFEVSAYRADRTRIRIPVDLSMDGGGALELSQATVTLEDEQAPATIISATPRKAGNGRLHVSPRLLTMPDCTSSIVTVTENL